MSSAPTQSAGRPVSSQLLRWIMDANDLPHMVPYHYEIVWPPSTGPAYVKVFIQMEMDEAWEVFDVPLSFGERQ